MTVGRYRLENMFRTSVGNKTLFWSLSGPKDVVLLCKIMLQHLEYSEFSLLCEGKLLLLHLKPTEIAIKVKHFITYQNYSAKHMVLLLVVLKADWFSGQILFYGTLAENKKSQHCSVQYRHCVHLQLPWVCRDLT